MASKYLNLSTDDMLGGNTPSDYLAVSQKAIKTYVDNNSGGGGLPSQTGNANKFLTTDGTDASWAAVPTRNIGEIVESTIPLTDAGLHLLDGALIQGSGIYSAFVTYMAGLYDNTPISSYKSNVTKIGSLTNNNGVLSGFSETSYARFPSNFQPSLNPWEMVFKVTTGTISSSWQHILSFQKGLTNAERYATRLSITPNNKFGITLSYNSTAWDVAGETTGQGTHTVLSNTTYYLKFEYTGSAYILSYSLDGDDYTQDCYVASSTPIYNANTASLVGIWNNGSYVEPFLGSIDLKESYININGSRWWTGAEAIKPVFCTEEQWQTAVTTYGVCGKFVYDSVNNTVRLQKFYSAERYLIYSNSSGTSWYRVYSDGWCEQGGVSQSAGDQTTNTINLPRNYIDTNYSILFAQNAGVEGSYTNGCTAKNKTTNSFALVYRTGGTASFYWKTCGYTDISTYINQKQYQYIVIATSTKTDIQVDIDEIATDLNGKADVDLTNVPSSKGILVENYQNGTSWYRVYSDGWCEQGGKTTGNGSYGSTQVILLKSYTDTTYSVLIAAADLPTSNFTNSGSATVRGLMSIIGGVATKTTSSFLTASDQDICWTTCGYIS